MEDRGFLNEVTSKLREVARSQTFSPSSEDGEAGEDNDKVGRGRDGSEGQESEPEVEPRLRIKRSMNFGSEWGASRCGKGF